MMINIRVEKERIRGEQILIFELVEVAHVRTIVVKKLYKMNIIFLNINQFTIQLPKILIQLRILEIYEIINLKKQNKKKYKKINDNVF